MKLNINQIDTLIKEILDLISSYQQIKMAIPSSLKGNIGELMVYKELLLKFPNKEIEFSGGTRPSFDIQIEGKKIQVKTQIAKDEKYVVREGCPTVKRKIIEEKKCDFIRLVILYPSRDFSSINESNIYIFNQDDFKLFSPILCWSGNSNGDYTICNILEVKPNISKKLGEKIAHYKTEEYKKLFKKSKDNWNKIISV